MDDKIINFKDFKVKKDREEKQRPKYSQEIVDWVFINGKLKVYNLKPIMTSHGPSIRNLDQEYTEFWRGLYVPKLDTIWFRVPHSSMKNNILIQKYYGLPNEVLKALRREFGNTFQIDSVWKHEDD